MSKLVCTSPVDGTIYAERPLADDGAVAAAIARARAAQADWRDTPVAERARLCAAMTDAMVTDRFTRPLFSVATSSTS